MSSTAKPTCKNWLLTEMSSHSRHKTHLQKLAVDKDVLAQQTHSSPAKLAVDEDVLACLVLREGDAHHRLTPLAIGLNLGKRHDNSFRGWFEGDGGIGEDQLRRWEGWLG